MTIPIFRIEVENGEDVIYARKRAWQIAGKLGFEFIDRTRITLAVSEIALNALSHGGGGEVEFLLEDISEPQMLLIRVQDRGSGIKDVRQILEEQRSRKDRPKTGIYGVQQLMDRFDIESRPGEGTAILMGKAFRPGMYPATRGDIAKIAADLSETLVTLSDAVGDQNQSIFALLDDLKTRQEEINRISRELDDTNLGVLALYAELDETAEYLKRAGETRSLILSYMSHEFRSPLSSVIGLSEILLDRIDGELTPEQEKQISLIHKSAQGLLEMITDLLEMTRIEAGKTIVHPDEFQVADLYRALRGALRPIKPREGVSLIVEDPANIPAMCSDEGKITQILRNLISNAIKFTEKGEIRVSARLTPSGRNVIFSVSDTGIGIAPEDQKKIFQEFSQIESPLQKQARGTGLGLSLSRRLATLLGGSISVKSRPGEGSTFSVIIPLQYEERALREEGMEKKAGWQIDPTRFPVLVVEDDPEAVALYEKYLRGSGIQIISAHTTDEARSVLRAVCPLAIILDILLPGEEGWALLSEIKGDPSSRDIPVLVVSILNEPEKGMILGADDYMIKPVERDQLLQKLNQYKPIERILIVDDEDASRYLLRSMLSDTRYTIIEAKNGSEGLRLAVEEKPHLIFLDLIMPGMSGFEVLEELKSAPETSKIPVVVITAKVLTNEEREQLKKGATAILSKRTKSRADAIAQIREILARIRPERVEAGTQ